ncbi:MAG: glutaminase A [Verrucomicrobiota bacterium]
MKTIRLLCLCALAFSSLPGLRAGTMPEPAALQKAVDDAYAKFKDEKGGANASYIPYLAKVPSNLFGVAIVTVDGKIYTAGDVGYAFAIESVSKPFTASLVMNESGPETILNKIGVEPTGLPFNSVVAIELEPTRSVNPFVNPGAMAAVSLVKAKNPQGKWEKILAQYSKFAGEKLAMSDEVYQSEASCNQHNRGIAELLFSYNRLYADPLETCDVYTKQCSVLVTAKQLAVMGATIANGGVNPLTKERCLEESSVPKLLAVMMMAGFYDESGAWAWKSGLPSKTGVGGGIVSIVPGKMAIVGFAPPLDAAGNSVRGASAIQQIVADLNLNLFNSK